MCRVRCHKHFTMARIGSVRRVFANTSSAPAFSYDPMATRSKEPCR
jgi:hypothetical protein